MQYTIAVRAGRLKRCGRSDRVEGKSPQTALDEFWRVPCRPGIRVIGAMPMESATRVGEADQDRMALS
jgi:hypothetical protein